MTPFSVNFFSFFSRFESEGFFPLKVPFGSSTCFSAGGIGGVRCSGCEVPFFLTFTTAIFFSLA